MAGGIEVNVRAVPLGEIAHDCFSVIGADVDGDVGASLCGQVQFRRHVI
jgi:hypothetical protein